MPLRALPLLLCLAVACGGEKDDPTGWQTDAREHRPEVGKQFEYLCPGGGQPGQVWGTDVYSDDSSVCTAAVHAGKLTFEKGGRVTIEIVADPGSYSGSTRNGVTSEPLGPWENAFQFAK